MKKNIDGMVLILHVQILRSKKSKTKSKSRSMV